MDPYLDLGGCDGGNQKRNGDHATATRTNACCRRRSALFEGFSGPFSHRIMHLYLVTKHSRELSSAFEIYLPHAPLVYWPVTTDTIYLLAQTSPRH